MVMQKSQDSTKENNSDTQRPDRTWRWLTSKGTCPLCQHRTDVKIIISIGNVTRIIITIILSLLTAFPESPFMLKQKCMQCGTLFRGKKVLRGG